jgi:DNA (cytosine-5)-methyltransferase 1
MSGPGLAIELCAGLGGIGIGLRAVGYEVAKAYDSWPEAVAIYNHNVRGHVAATANLLSKAGRELVEADCRRLGAVDLVAAGPPCKGFSQLRNGHHDGRNGQNRVLAALPDYVAMIKPRMFLIENVRDLIRHRNGKTLATLLERLSKPARGIAYRVEFKIYDAAALGTPQARRRILILGVRKGDRARLPEPAPDLTPLFTAVRHGGKVPLELQPYLAALRDPEDGTLTTVSQALSDLPALGPGAPEAERAYASPATSAYQRWVREGAGPMLRDTQTPGVNEVTIRRLKHIPPGGCARSIPRRLLNGLSRRYDSAYRRLHPDAPSTALSTKYDCAYHYIQERSLSIREYARLQGIPDAIEFPTNLACRRSCYEMIGNSVPPLLVERVLGAVLDDAPTGLP